MKNVLLLFIFSIASTGAFSQTETLFSNIRHVGGFGGPMIEISQINGETIADVGGGGALILNNFFFGGYGMGTNAPNISIDQDVFDINFRHGGLWFGYTYKPQKLVHLYSSFRLGWGQANLIDGAGEKQYADNILALSPEVGIEINLTSWIRVGLTGGYRFVDGINSLEEASQDLTDDSFSSPFGNITFRFGGFGSWNNDEDKDDKNIDFDF